MKRATTTPAAKPVGRIPRITTRGCYSLDDGRAMRPNPTYRLYPRYYFEKITGTPELVIMVHGLRNDDRGASAKTVIAREMLQRLGHDECQVAGFSYDANVRNAHRIQHMQQSFAVGRRIAEANGRHLARFITEFRLETNGKTRIRLLGHSLGSIVIHNAVMHLAGDAAPAGDAGAGKDMIESIHLFGASLPADIQNDAGVRRAIDHIVRDRFVNCYAPTDEVLAWADSHETVSGAGSLGLNGAVPGMETAAKYRQKRTKPENHRFASYADALRSFP